MLNSVVVMGRLAADPIVRRTSSGIAVANIRLACDRDVKKEGQEKQCDFFDVIAWRQQAEFVEKYFFRGKPMLVQGRLQQRTWEAQDGSKRNVVEILAERIEFCGGEKKDAKPVVADFEELGGTDEELPF